MGLFRPPVWPFCSFNLKLQNQKAFFTYELLSVYGHNRYFMIPLIIFLVPDLVTPLHTV